MSAQISITGRLTKPARLITSATNDQTELLYFTLATDLFGYTDQNKNNEWVQITQFYDVQLSFKKGMAQRWIENNMLAQGHLVKLTNMMILQRDPKEHKGKYYPNNLFCMLPNMSMYDNVQFLQYPHALKSNSTQSAPKQTPNEAQKQTNTSSDGSQAQSVKVNPQAPTIDFDDDIPFG
jgi:hypothetical protein